MTVLNPEVKPEPVLNQEKPISSSPVNDQKPLESAAKTEIEEDANFKAFREGRKKDRMEREAAEKRAAEKEAEAQALKAAMEAILNKGSNNSLDQSRIAYNEEAEETEDQKIEKKVQAALAQREAALEKERQRREIEEYPKRLQEAYPDFNQIIGGDNLDYLEYHYPEVAAPLKRLPDGFEKWSDIYRAVKKFVPNTNHKKEQIRGEQNLNKPRSLSSTGPTLSGESGPPIRLDEARKAANWERMQRTMKGLS